MINTVTIHPQLRTDITLAAALSLPVQPFIRFKPAISDASSQELVSRVVDRVTRQTGIEPQVEYRNTDRVLHVLAPVRFLERLLTQPEIAEASPVPGYTSAMIPPRDVRVVSEHAIDKPVARGPRSRKLGPSGV
jgi:hypothetical protein